MNSSSSYADTMTMSADNESMGDTGSTISEDDFTLIDYARYHGLCEDYTTSYPLSFQRLKLPTWTYSISEGDDLPEFTFQNVVELDEKWAIDHQSALFLKQIASTEATPTLEVTPRINELKDFKIEPLLLPINPELDQRRFKRTLEARRSQDTQILLNACHWPTDIETQLYWPDTDLPNKLLEETKQEKLQLERNDILFLQQCVSIQEDTNFEGGIEAPRKKIQEEQEAARHSSPLLPCSSPYQLGIPDSPVSRMPLATSPIDPISMEISKIEETMDLDDEFSLDDLSDVSMFDIKPPNEPYTNSPLKRKRPEDFKAEVPLSPALQASSPIKRIKMVTFSDELCTTIPEYAKPFSSEDSNSVDERYNEFFNQIIEPGAKSAIESINNEHLTEADSTLRAEVPEIDQTGPLPPWDVFSRKQLGCQTVLKAQQQLISMLKRETIKPQEAWPSVARVDKAMTRWRPFDMRLSDIPEEEMGCDDLDDFKPKLPDDTTSGWKLDGLRILDACEDDDDEVDHADMTTGLESMSLTEHEPVSKEPINMASLKPRFFIQSGSSLAPLPRTDTHMPLEHLQTVTSRDDTSQPLLGGTFSASTALDRFMQIHTGNAKTKGKVKEQAEPQAKAKNVSELAARPALKVKEEDNLNATINNAPMHLPTLPTTTPHRTFVLSSTMFDKRSLIRELERLNPSAGYIERDFTSARALRGMSSQTSEADEADIILAPGHGLLLTTLQKVKQKSLPGEASRNLVRERILQLGRRYERLIVMVSEDCGASGNSAAGMPQRPLDDRDGGELSSLINFCAAQSHDIQLLYIPGDESVLATWIVASMVRFGLDDPEVKLLQDETHWELFLRKAGMDAFAAQVVLTKLKRPDSMPVNSDGRNYGLPAFVMMSESERLRRFSSLFGGEKILTKVSMAIDGCWARPDAGNSKR